MTLPNITLPEIDIAFDIPVLLHPAVDHFAIALPVLILFFELINFVAKKRAISLLSISLLFLVMIVSVLAYLTGIVDGKETLDALSQAGQAELKEHKLLGTYLLLASVVLFVFKLLSLMIKKRAMQILYLLLLIVFVAGILKQGHDGGELVYEYGANVKNVETLPTSSTSKNKEKIEEVSAVKQEVLAPSPIEATLQNATQQLEEVKNEALSTVKNKVEEVVDTVVEVVPLDVEQPKIDMH